MRDKSNLHDKIDRTLDMLAMRGTPKQRRLARRAIEFPAKGHYERGAQLFRVMGRDAVEEAFRMAFPGQEIWDPPASETQQ